MRELFDSWRIWAKYQTESLGYQGARSVYYNAIQASLWPQRTLESWISLIDQAYEDIAGLKTTDEALYNSLKEHICIESISYRYLLLELYHSNYDSVTLATMKKEFLSDISRIGMTLMANGKTIDSITGAWDF
jgi:hypothetical protein